MTESLKRVRPVQASLSTAQWVRDRNAQVHAANAGLRPAPPRRLSPAQASTPRRSGNQSGASAGHPRQRHIDWTAQVRAGVRGVRDSLPFGAGQGLEATTEATLDASHGVDFSRALLSHLAGEQTQARYDAAHYGAARLTGQILGTGAQIGLLGLGEGAIAGGVRMAQATPIIAREVAALGGMGAAAGVGSQALSDVALNKRSSLADYAGSGLGGAVGTLSSLGGRATWAGSIDGAVTSVAQDIFNGRAPSITRANQAAETGGLLGFVGGVAGRRFTNKLTARTKGKLGEGISPIRSLARGDQPLSYQTAIRLKGGKVTKADQITKSGQVVETKLGVSHKRLRGAQLQASKELPDYRVDHWLPQDIGVALGLPLAMFGHQPYLPGAQTLHTIHGPLPAARR